MAINTTVQPFISQMLRQPDPAAIGDVVGDSIGGFIGAHLARKDVDAEDAARVAAGGQPRSGFDKFADAYNRTPGRIQQGRETYPTQRASIIQSQATVAADQATLAEQTRKLMSDPKAVADEIGNLTPEQIPGWLQRNAGLAAHPIGKAMLEATQNIYNQSSQAKIKAAQSQHMADLAIANPDADLASPDGIAQANRQYNLNKKSVPELYKRAHDQGKLLNTLPDDWFNPDGSINEQKAVPGLGQLPRSEALQSREEMAYDKLQNQLDLMQFKIDHGIGYTPGALEKDMSFAESEMKAGKITADEFGHYSRVRHALEPKPAVEHLSEEEYVSRHLDTTLHDSKAIVDPKTGKTRPPKSRDEAVSVLRQEYGKLKGAQAAPAPATSAPVDNVRVKSPDGVIGTIPRSQLPGALKQGYIEYAPGKPGYEG